MDSSAFYEKEPIDRSKNGACVTLAIIVLLIWLAGAWLLWRASGYVRQHRWFSWHIPSFSLPSTDLNGVEQSLQQKAADASKNASDAAANAASNAVKNGVGQGVQQAQDQANQSLQQYLK